MRGKINRLIGRSFKRQKKPTTPRFSSGLTKSAGSILPHVVFIPFVIINLFFPFFMLFASFKTNTDYFVNPAGLPTEWTIESYKILFFERPFLQQLLNSVIVSSSTIVVALLISIPAAYGYSRLKFRGRQSLFDFTIALMAVPVVVTIVPLFVLMIRLHLINRYPSAVIVYVGFSIPFTIYVLTGFFRSIPRDLLDAAKADGANHLQIIRHIIVPLAKAPLVTLSIVNGLWVWNELLIALIFLQKESSTTLMASLARGVSRDVRNVPLIMAGAFAASIPVILLMAFGQRYFVKGFLGGHSR